MGASAYPLRALLELRQREREAAEADLHRRAQALARAQVRFGETEERLAALSSEQGGRPPSGSLARDWQTYSGMVTRILDQREKNIAELARLSAELAEGRALYAGASSREEALVRHRDRFLEARAEKLRKRDEAAADDRAASRAQRAVEGGW